MVDSTERAIAVVANAAGNTVNGLVAGALATAAIVTGNHDLAMVPIATAALGGALTEHGLLLINQTIADRQERVRRLIDRVAADPNKTAEDFAAEHLDTEAKRDLFARVVAAAADARSAWKIATLARSFVRGSKNEDLVDETIMMVDLLSKLDHGHVRVLAAVRATPLEHGARWPDSVRRQDPGIQSAFPFLWRDVKKLELVSEGSMRVDLTDLGTNCVQWLVDLGPTDDQQ